MAPPAITVSPTALLDAGGAVLSASKDLAAGLDSLFSALDGCGGMCGDDPAGIVLAHHTDQATHAVIKALTDTLNGTARVGDAVKASASNYDRANHHSSVAPMPGAPIPFPAPTPVLSPRYPPSPEGGAGEPGFWKAVESLIGMVWPNGDPGKLRTAAGAWRTMAATCHGAAAQLAAPARTCDMQKIPEAISIDTLLGKSTTALNDAGSLCVNLAAQLEACAARIDDVHRKLRDLVKRIGNPASLGSEVISFFTGGNGDIDKIIDDVKSVLGNFAHEVGEVGALIGSYAEQAAHICVVMAQMLAIELKQVVVKPVYNGLAELVNTVASSANFAWQHPVEMLETAAGAAMTAAGAATFVAGVPEDATIVLAPAGLAVNAAGVATTAAGVGMMGKGLHDLASSADSNSGVTVMHAMSDSDGVGPNLGRDGVNPRYSGDLAKVNKDDPNADLLGARIGGQSRVRFGNDPDDREFDAVSDDYIGQDKPANYQFNASGRNQAKATFTAAQQNGRGVYYHFDGEPPAGTIAKLNEYSTRYNVPLVIDTTPYS